MLTSKEVTFHLVYVEMLFFFFYTFFSIIHTPDIDFNIFLLVKVIIQVFYTVIRLKGSWVKHGGNSNDGEKNPTLL